MILQAHPECWQKPSQSYAHRERPSSGLLPKYHFETGSLSQRTHSGLCLAMDLFIMAGVPLISCALPHRFSRRALPRCRRWKYFRQPLEIQQPAHQIGFVSDSSKPSSTKHAEVVPALGFAPELFDLLSRPLRAAGASRLTQPPHSLMPHIDTRPKEPETAALVESRRPLRNRAARIAFGCGRCRSPAGLSAAGDPQSQTAPG